MVLASGINHCLISSLAPCDEIEHAHQPFPVSQKCEIGPSYLVEKMCLVRHLVAKSLIGCDIDPSAAFDQSLSVCTVDDRHHHLADVVVVFENATVVVAAVQFVAVAVFASVAVLAVVGDEFQVVDAKYIDVDLIVAGDGVVAAFVVAVLVVAVGGVVVAVGGVVVAVGRPEVAVAALVVVVAFAVAAVTRAAVVVAFAAAFEEDVAAFVDASVVAVFVAAVVSLVFAVAAFVAAAVSFVFAVVSFVAAAVSFVVVVAAFVAVIVAFEVPVAVFEAIPVALAAAIAVLVEDFVASSVAAFVSSVVVVAAWVVVDYNQQHNYHVPEAHVQTSGLDYNVQKSFAEFVLLHSLDFVLAWCFAARFEKFEQTHELRQSD